MRRMGWLLFLGLLLGPARSWALSGVANEITVQDGLIGIVDPLAVNKGGTGVASLTDRAVLVGRGTAGVEFAAPGNAGQTLLSTGAAANPAFGALDLADTDARTGTLGVGNGGTGATTLTIHGVLMGNTTGAINASAAGTSGQPFLSGGASVDGAYGAVSLSGAGVTGTLPVANGGTNSSTALNNARCMRSSGGAIVEAATDCASAAAAPILTFGTIMNITAGTTVFAAPGNGVDQTENIVSVPMPAATFTNMRCRSSAAPAGSDTFIITARSGACGSEADDADFVCTISGAALVCTQNPDTETVVTTAGQCLSFRIVSSATAATAAVKCSVERTS